MHRRDLLARLGASALVGTAGCAALRSETDGPDRGAPEEVLGVAHLDGRYHHTDDPFLREGATVIAELGTNVIKVWLDFPSWYYGSNSDWADEYATMVDVAREPGYRQLFEGPFSTYLLKATANHRYPPNYFRDGVGEWDLQQERDRFEDLTRHLLETYDGTGKTFVLQDAEGDGWAAPDRNPANELPGETVGAMIRWLRARQTGVERGREAVDSDAMVLHAAEVSVVLDAREYGTSRVVNEVLPEVDLDLVSYSSWELGGQLGGGNWLPGQNGREQYDESDELVVETLEYVRDQFSPTGAADRVLGDDQQPVFLGEFGAPLQETGEERGLRDLRSVLEPSLEWGVRWAVYWQVYCNERVTDDGVATEGTVSENDEVRGFYLVRPDGTRAPSWDYLEEVLARDVTY